MSRNRIILLPGSIVWTVDGVETDRIPMKPEFNILHGYIGTYGTIFNGEDVDAFDPFDGLSNACNFAVCCGLSEEQMHTTWMQKFQEQSIPDCTKRLIHALMTMHAGFYNAYCDRREHETRS